MKYKKCLLIWLDLMKSTYKHSKLEMAEMEQRFNISGTHEELKAILEKEFNLSDEEARIATAVLVYEQNREQKQDQLEEDTLWFLNDSKDEYQSRFFSTRYSISFTKAMLGVFDELLISVVIAACGGKEFAALSTVLSCIKVLKNNVRKIKDNECCVYFQVIDYLKNHSDKWFSAQQVMPDTSGEGICVNLDKNWKCKFRCGEHTEECSIQLDDVKKILDTFCTDDVMKPNDDETLYRFKI